MNGNSWVEEATQEDGSGQQTLVCSEKKVNAVVIVQLVVGVWLREQEIWSRWLAIFKLIGLQEA